jgi:hypothetical protein
MLLVVQKLLTLNGFMDLASLQRFIDLITLHVSSRSAKVRSMCGFSGARNCQWCLAVTESTEPTGQACFCQAPQSAKSGSANCAWQRPLSKLTGANVGKTEESPWA